jgi:hypothetical protein
MVWQDALPLFISIGRLLGLTWKYDEHDETFSESYERHIRSELLISYTLLQMPKAYRSGSPTKSVYRILRLDLIYSLSSAPSIA